MLYHYAFVLTSDESARFRRANPVEARRQALANGRQNAGDVEVARPCDFMAVREELSANGEWRQDEHFP